MNLQNSTPHVRVNPRLVWLAILTVVVLELALAAIQLPYASIWSAAAARADQPPQAGLSHPVFHAVPAPTPPAAAHHPAATPAPSFTNPEPQPRPVPTPPAGHSGDLP